MKNFNKIKIIACGTKQVQEIAIRQKSLEKVVVEVVYVNYNSKLQQFSFILFVIIKITFSEHLTDKKFQTFAWYI